MTPTIPHSFQQGDQQTVNDLLTQVDVLCGRSLCDISAYSMEEDMLLDSVKLCTKLVMTSIEEQKWFKAEWTRAYEDHVVALGLS